MDLNLEGRRTLLLGGTSGLGLAIAAAMAAEGAELVAVSRSRRRAVEAAEVVHATTNADIKTVQVDLATPDGPQVAVDETVASLGGLDILINSVPAPGFGTFESHSDADWQTALEGKFFVYLRAIRACLPHFERSGGGVVANVIGTGGKTFVPQHIAGGAGNAALMLLTLGLAKELGSKGVRVVGISPGATESPRLSHLIEQVADASGEPKEAVKDALVSRVPLGVLPQAADVANVVAFLVSDAARQVNGTVVTVDGGADPSL